MKSLILTEKPSVARDFLSAFSGPQSKSNLDGYFETENYVITWAIGHLLAPFDPEDYDLKYKKWSLATLPILPIDFKFKAQPKTKNQLEVIKKLIKRSDLDRIIVATDAGREGELIARLILNESKSKLKSFRFFTSAALTKEVIQQEMNKLKPLYEYDRLYIAGRARQRADWLVGMNLSRLATIKLGDLFSVGRVQTAVLSLLVDRRKSIDQFLPSDYFELKTKFKFNNQNIETYWFDPKKKEEEKRLDKSDEFEIIQKKCLGQQAIIKVLNEVQKTQYSQGLYSLTELQREANTRFGFSASKTLELAQSLYERHKCLSYPRTDSKVMASSSLELVKGLVYKFKEIYPEYFQKFVPYKVSLKNKIVFDDSKLTDHHGLIPLKSFGGNENSPEGKIFALVLKRFISNFLENHVYLETEVEIICKSEHFKTKGRRILEQGFKILDGAEKEIILPDLALNQVGVFENSEIESKKTKPPHEYTEASILYDMTNPARLVEESNYKKIFRTEVGLGTQATRAQIIETLILRNYVERVGKNLKVTQKGLFLIEKLESLPSTKKLTNVSQTAQLEIQLQNMAEGETDDLGFLDYITDSIILATNEWNSVIQISPPKENGTSKFKKNSDFKVVVQFKCPLCQASIMNYPKSYSCSRWKEGCGFTIWKIIARKKISDSHIKMLIEKKKTSLIKGFKSKAGKPFNAHLVLNSLGKVEFDFEKK